MSDSFDPVEELAPTRGIEPIDPREMLIVQAVHAVAQRHDLVIACTRCRQPFQGLNAPEDPTHAIACGCRELRAMNRGKQTPHLN